MFINDTKGYSLVEVLVAITILLLALTGPLTIASKGLQSAYFAREQTTAVFLAQEGVEAVTSMRNSAMNQAHLDDLADPDALLGDSWNWTNNLESDCGSGCTTDFNTVPIVLTTCVTQSNCKLYLHSTGRARYSHTSSGGTESIYTRQIFITGGGATNHIVVRSVVSWTGNLFSGSSKVELETVLFDVYDSIFD